MDADYIVVGAGSAGCVLAARLSEHPDCKVVLCEAGGENDTALVRQPGSWQQLWASTHNWGYATVRQAGYNFRVIDCPRGKGLGGTSAINAMLYVRGDARDFDHWAQLGNEGWSWAQVLPYFIKAEDQQRGASALHGVGGPLRVSDPPSPHPLSVAFIEAAAAVGHATNADFNGDSQAGVGLYQRTIADGERWSAARAYLDPARGRANLAILTAAHVTRLKFAGRRCIGVEVYRAGQIETLTASREVVLCCGAIDSPRLLMLSGIGDPDELCALGLLVVEALPGVGRNLHDHPISVVLQAARQPQPPAESSNHVEAGLFMKLSGANDGFDADLQFHFAPCAPMLAIPMGLARGPSIAVNTCRPRSRGRLRLRSAAAFDAPLIDPAYMIVREDLLSQVAGLRAAREIFAAQPLAHECTGELVPGSALGTDMDLERAVRTFGDCVWHPVGTCRMGHNDEAVVDAQLRVHGVDGLRIADASVMPQITSGNTNAPVIMLAEKAADLIRQAAT